MLFNDSLTPVFQEVVGEILDLMPDKFDQMKDADPIFKYFPIMTTKDPKARWSIRDNFTGLQSASSLEGAPALVNRVGRSMYAATPIKYREFMRFGEKEIEGLRELNDFSRRQEISSVLADAKMQFDIRQQDRIINATVKLATGGSVTITDNIGNKVGQIQYSITTAKPTPGAEWNNPTTSTPLADIRAYLQDAAIGTSSRFGPNTVMLMNQVTVNAMLNNQNPNDLGGKRMANGASIVSLAQLNEIMVANDLPKIEVYDSNYIPDGSAAGVRHLSNGDVLFIGDRPNGQPVGNYLMTLNLVGNVGSGPYFFMLTPEENPNGRLPLEYQIHQGHNGLPVIYYPSALRVFRAFG